VAATTNHDTVRPFAIDEPFYQMRKYACERDAAQHVIGWLREVPPATPLRAPPFHPQAMSSPEALALSGAWLRARRLD
jgi:hypothetical protein